MRSSGALLAIIGDILDLASIDTGSLELVPESVDIHATIEAAMRGLEDRLAEASLEVVIDAPADIGSFVADGKRVRQILFNLLSNAIGFSYPGQKIHVVARKLGATEAALFASPSYLARRGGPPREPADLARHEFVLFRGKNGRSDLKLRGPDGEHHTVAVTGRINANDFPFVRTALRSGAGVGVRPVFTAARDKVADLPDDVLNVRVRGFGTALVGIAEGRQGSFGLRSPWTDPRDPCSRRSCSRLVSCAGVRWSSYMLIISRIAMRSSVVGLPARSAASTARARQL